MVDYSTPGSLGLHDVNISRETLMRNHVSKPGTVGIYEEGNNQSLDSQINLEISQLQAQIKYILDQSLKTERAETARLAQTLKDSSSVDKTLIYTGAAMTGAIDAVTGLILLVGDVAATAGKSIQAVNRHIGQYLLDPLHAPETFERDLASLKTIYTGLENFIDEDLEGYWVLVRDPETWQILNDFAVDYMEAQHSTELTKIAGESIPTIILALLTGGAGAVMGTAGSGASRLAQLAAKVGPMLRKLIILLKKRPTWQKKSRPHGGQSAENIPKNTVPPSSNKGNKPAVQKNENIKDVENIEAVKANSPSGVKNTKAPKKFNTNPKDIRVAAHSWPAEKKLGLILLISFITKQDIKTTIVT